MSSELPNFQTQEPWWMDSPCVYCGVKHPLAEEYSLCSAVAHCGAGVGELRQRIAAIKAGQENDGMTSVSVGKVCIVTEIRRLDRSESLYGVWETEEMARRDYGIEDDRYAVRFDNVSVWGFRHV